MDFVIDPSTAEETFEPGLSPDRVVEHLALLKSRDVAGRHENALIIGADTIVVYKDQILGKPENRNHASELLNMLSGQTHQVYTGVGLVQTGSDGKIVDTSVFNECTRVTFDRLSEEEIEEYIDTGSPMDKAGSYGIQDDWGSLFVRKVDGDYYNVVGFPLNRFYREMKHFAPALLPHAAPSKTETL